MKYTSNIFTDAYIAALVPSNTTQDYLEPGSHGFGVRVSPTGVKKFFYRYNLEGKRRFLSLGYYKDSKTKSGITLADARKRYVAARNSVLEGSCPVAQAQASKITRKDTPFLSEFIDDYINTYAKFRNKGWKNIGRALRMDLVPTFGKHKITDITRKDLMFLLDSVAQRTPVGANRLYSYTRSLFTFAVNRNILEQNPFFNMPMPGGPEKSKDRHLTDPEIKTFLSNLHKLPGSDIYKDALEMILLTGQRPGEVLGMSMSEVEGDWWTLPPERVKNKDTHRVFLTSSAKDLIKGKGMYPFKQKRYDTPINQPLLAAAVRNHLDIFDVIKFTPHDLRRTMATGLARIGVLPDLISRIQNHRSAINTGVNLVYNRYTYDEEKKQAMLKWEAHLIKLIK